MHQNVVVYDIVLIDGFYSTLLYVVMLRLVLCVLLLHIESQCFLSRRELRLPFLFARFTRQKSRNPWDGTLESSMSNIFATHMVYRLLIRNMVSTRLGAANT